MDHNIRMVLLNNGLIAQGILLYDLFHKGELRDHLFSLLIWNKRGTPILGHHIICQYAYSKLPQLGSLLH